MSKEAKQERMEKMIRDVLEDKDSNRSPTDAPTPEDYRSQTSLRQTESNDRQSRPLTSRKIHPH